MRTITIHLRMSPEQRDLIGRAARVLGKSRSDFTLDATCDRAQAVLLDQICFGLDEDKFQQFVSLLDDPPGPNPGLERLFAVLAPWSKV